MNLDLIKNKVLSIFDKHNLVLFEILEERMGKEKILTVLIDSKIEHEALEAIHMEVLDEIDELLPDGYYLQLSTVGIEKPLRNIDEVTSNVGGFVYIESSSFNGQGTLTKVENNVLFVHYFIKGRPKNIEINYENVSFIRQAVKF